MIPSFMIPSFISDLMPSMKWVWIILSIMIVMFAIKMFVQKRAVSTVGATVGGIAASQVLQ